MADGRKNNGGKRPGSGRKTNAQLQKIKDRLSPLDDKAFAQLEAAIDAGERWAITLYFAYMYGKPVERKEVTGPNGNNPIVIDLNKYL